jgi:hypothetical protein
MGVDPIVLAAALYLAALFLADRMLEPARRELSPEEKVRLVDVGSGIRSAAYIPSAAAVLVLGSAIMLWPRHPSRIVIAVYVVFVGVTAMVSFYSWRQIRALEIRDSYLRRWALSRIVYTVAVASLCGYIAGYYVDLPV